VEGLTAPLSERSPEFHSYGPSASACGFPAQTAYVCPLLKMIMPRSAAVCCAMVTELTGRVAVIQVQGEACNRFELSAYKHPDFVRTDITARTGPTITSSWNPLRFSSRTSFSGTANRSLYRQRIANTAWKLVDRSQVAASLDTTAAATPTPALYCWDQLLACFLSLKVITNAIYDLR
jgi:hypothetical protein